MVDLQKIDAQPRTTKGVVLLTTPEWDAVKQMLAGERRVTNKALEWEAMVREVKMLRSQNECLTMALEEIVSPLVMLQRRASINNEKLERNAYTIATSASHLQEIARQALRDLRR